ncbi:hypothetical protein LAG90_08430 [Marinilongibacter aquaticus]|uniref:hypothetical protein n=1 Tax=Marinilongibacter aquaticus TaxID=2975157 RepID=UPI0021BDB9F8|nr:hypothetical protein [Marinilongibacter aquaticus]UBM60666.1 hypothetical protein LAG90_08430 [Marinilongibacter aquaticus]
MSYKWNEAQAQHYAEEFSDLVCKEFFRNKEYIQGDELVGVTQIKQLNMLLIKNMFGKWQEETKQLKSPFFNYEHEEVQKALQQFMNTLSQHISIQQESFKALLTQAVFDTLQLAQAPKDYFEKALRNLPDFKLTKEWLVKNEKYFFINKHILRSLKERLGESVTYANQAILWLQETMADHETDNIDELLEDFNRVLPLKKDSVEGKSFFDDALEKAMSVSRKVERKEPELKHTEEPVWAKYMSPKAATSQPVIEEKVEVKSTVVQDFTPPKVETPPPAPIVDKRLNERHEGATVTFNERISKPSNGTSLSDRKHKIQSLKEGISLNQRYLYIRDLFGGDHNAFVHSLEELESYPNLQEARKHLENTVSKKFHWDKTSESVEEFYNHLERKFE